MGATLALDQALRGVRGALDQVAHVVRRLAESPEHVGRHDVGVGGIRPPDAHAHAVEVSSSEILLQRLQAVVSGQPAAQARLHVAERQVDLVVDHDDAVERHPERAARRTRGATGLVHVGLWHQDADARSAGHRPTVREEPGELLLRARHVPALGQAVRNLEADVVARARVAVAGVPEPHYQPVDAAARRLAAKEAQEPSGSSPPGPAPAAASSPVAPSAAASASALSAASPSATSSVSSSISGSSGTSVGTVIVAMTVSSGLSRKVTPFGAVSSASVSVPAASSAETSTSMRSGMSDGSASMFSSRATCSSTPPSLTPGASSAPWTSTITVVWITTLRFTWSMSMCMTSLRTGCS